MKYLASALGALALATALFVAGYWQGHLSETAKYNAYVAATQAAAATAANAARTAQAQADATALAQSQAAIAAAHSALIARQADLNSSQATLSKLRSEVASYAKQSSESIWLAQPIPPDLVGKLCLYPQASHLTANCPGSSSPVPPTPRGRH